MQVCYNMYLSNEVLSDESSCTDEEGAILVYRTYIIYIYIHMYNNI